MNYSKELFTKMLAPLFAALTIVFFAFSMNASLARELFQDDAYSNYSADTKNGKYLFNASGCAACHSTGGDLETLSGGLKIDTFVGTIYTPNITSHPNGIGGWSNSQFLNAVINGISPTGRHYLPIFPYTAYAGMKPEDVLDIKAYINSLPQSDNRVPESEISFPYNLNATMSFWKRSNFTTQSWQPTPKTQINRGKYLVENVTGCGTCHTPRTMTYGLEEAQALKGNKGLTGSFAPDISSTILSSLTSSTTFTDTHFVEGNKLNGNPITDTVKKQLLKSMASITNEDKLAIYAYITGTEQKVTKPNLVAASCKASVSAPLVKLGNLDQKADDFIGKYCRNCHGLGESFEKSYSAGDLASIAADAAFITPGLPEKSRFYNSIITGRMPQGARPSDEEISDIASWIESLTEPSNTLASLQNSKAEVRQRPILKRSDFVNAAINDIGKVNEFDRRFIRYFSYRYQYNGQFPCESDEIYSQRQSLYVAGFNKLLNSVSLGNALVRPVSIPGTKGLLVRIDIRDLGWGDIEWHTLQNIYPYGLRTNDDPNLDALVNFTHTQVPIMRTDWFMANAAKPEIYNVLLKLPENIRELEHRIGVDADDNINQLRVARAAFSEGASGVSDHNRMVERHEMRQNGYYWKSYDFAESIQRQNLKLFPHGPADNEPLGEHLSSFEHDGGEMIFSLPNGLQGYYLSDNKGNRLNEGPEKIVSFRERPIGKGITIVNGRSCMDCHADGILSKRDELRSHIQNNNQFSLAQQKLLLKMYVEQEVMDKFYKADRDNFVDALRKIDAAEPIGNGGFKSKTAPGNKEIVTWYADLYEDQLDIDRLAAEFDMTAEEFRSAILKVSDKHAQQVLLSWILQLDAGSEIPRFEVEQQIARLYQALLDQSPLHQVVASSLDQPSNLPQYKQPDFSSNEKLRLSIKTGSTDVRVHDRMSFQISANKTCELQALYVESDGNVEEFPQQLLGHAILQANEIRHIPVAGSGNIEFDEPGHDETLILQCRVGGLGQHRLSKHEALAIAQKSGKPASRGIAFNLAEKAISSEGEKAFHMISFNVRH